MDQLPEEVESMKNSVAELARSLGLNVGGNTSTANINVNAGGVGVWIATTCCAVMLGMAVVVSAIVIDQQRQISDLHDYLSAIYAQAPHLRPEGDKSE